MHAASLSLSRVALPSLTRGSSEFVHLVQIDRQIEFVYLVRIDQISFVDREKTGDALLAMSAMGGTSSLHCQTMTGPWAQHVLN